MCVLCVYVCEGLVGDGQGRCTRIIWGIIQSVFVHLYAFSLTPIYLNITLKASFVSLEGKIASRMILI